MEGGERYGAKGQRARKAGMDRDGDGRTDGRVGCAGLLGLCKTVGSPAAPKALGALGFAHSPEDPTVGDGHPSPRTVCPSPGPRVRSIFGVPSEPRFVFEAPPPGRVPPPPAPCAAGSSGKSWRRTRKGSGKGWERKGCCISGCRSGRPSSLKAL